MQGEEFERVRQRFIELADELDWLSIDWNDVYDQDIADILPDGLENLTLEPKKNSLQVDSNNNNVTCKKPKQIEVIDLDSSYESTPKKQINIRNSKIILDDDSTDEDVSMTPKSAKKTPMVCDDDDDIFETQLIDTSIIKTPAKTKYSSVDSEDEEENVISDCSCESSEDYESDKENFQPSRTENNIIGKEFVKLRDQLIVQHYKEINKKAFGNKLPHMPLLTMTDVKSGTIRSPYLSWNKNLRTTAGVTRCFTRTVQSTGKVEFTAAIELSTKVIDDLHRMRKTLAHEMCHVAAFILDNVRGHGKTFFSYGEKVTRFCPDIGRVTTCHNYEIHYKFIFECLKCKQQIKRQSKSIDIEKQCCGVPGCGGRFQLLRQTKDNTGKTTLTTPKAPSKYNIFMKENYARIKQANPNENSKTIMALVAQEYKKK